jgi:hypothetical protein
MVMGRQAGRQAGTHQRVSKKISCRKETNDFLRVGVLESGEDLDRSKTPGNIGTKLR